MYDIIAAEGIKAEDFSFSKFFILSEVKNKIAKVPNLEEAAKLRNKKTLVLLDDYEFDIGLIKLFARGKAAFLIDLGRIIQSQGIKRAIELGKMRRFVRICVKYEVPFVLASFAKDKFSVRTSRELCNIAALVGLNSGQAKFALERLGEFL